MEDFNSILLNFGMDFIIEMVSFEFIKNSEIFKRYSKLPEINLKFCEQDLSFIAASIMVMGMV